MKLCLVIILSVISVAEATSYFTIGPNFKHSDIAPVIRISPDSIPITSHAYILTYLKDHGDLWYSQMSQNLDRRQPYWVYLAVYNDSDVAQILIFQLGHPNINAEAYISNTTHGTVKRYSGYKFIYTGQNTVTNDNRCHVKLTLPPNELSQVIIKISRNTLSPGLYLTPALVSTDIWETQLHHKIMFQGMLQGFLSMFIGLVFILFLINRDRSFLYYSLYFLTLLLNFSIAENFLLGRVIMQYTPGWVLLVLSSPYIGFGFFYPQFIGALLETKNHYPKRQQQLNNIARSALITYPVLLIIIYSRWHYAYELWISMMLFFMLYVSFITLRVVLIRKDVVGKYVAIGLALTILGIIIHFLTFKYNLHTNNVFFYAEAGVFGESILFLIALSVKFRRTAIPFSEHSREDGKVSFFPKTNKIPSTTNLESTYLAFKARVNGIKKLIEQVHRLPKLASLEATAPLFKKNVMSTSPLPPSEIKIALSALDEDFLQRVVEAIEYHLPNPTFSITLLAKEAGCSRVHLYRKVKAITNCTPTELVRHMRLDKAAKLLIIRPQNISEIALEVGFTNPSYFAKCFHAKFGSNPKDYIKNTTIKSLHP